MALTKVSYSMVAGAPVNALDKGASPSASASINTAAFQAALTELSPLGGTLWIPPGTYNIDGLLTIPGNVNVVGSAFRATTITQNGAFFAFKMETGSVIKDMAINGSALATGGIDISNIGWGTVTNVAIENFPAIGSIAIQLHESYRVFLEQVYIYTCGYGFKFTGNVTTLKVLKSNVSTCAIRAIDASSGSSDSIEAYFDTTYFESNRGPSPIYVNQAGFLVLKDCGFEDMCDGANAKMFWIANPASLTLENCNIGVFTSGQVITGAAYVIYNDTDAPSVQVTNCTFIRTINTAGYTLNLVKWFGGGKLTLIGNRIYGTWADDATIQKFALGGIDQLYSPTTFVSLNNMFGSTPYNQSPALAKIAAVVTSSGVTSTLFTNTLAIGTMKAGFSYKLVAWGRRVGTANNKKVSCKIVGSSTVTIDITADISTATAWRAEINIIVYDGASQGLNFVGNEIASSLAGTSQLTQNNATNSFEISLVANCVDAADSITLDCCNLTAL